MHGLLTLRRCFGPEFAIAMPNFEHKLPFIL